MRRHSQRHVGSERKGRSMMLDRFNDRGFAPAETWRLALFVVLNQDASTADQIERSVAGL
jgi:hypothetical protein